jgi:hypothetical protein
MLYQEKSGKPAGWASFWAIFSRTHPVTLTLVFFFGRFFGRFFWAIFWAIFSSGHSDSCFLFWAIFEHALQATKNEFSKGVDDSKKNDEQGDQMSL